MAATSQDREAQVQTVREMSVAIWGANGSPEAIDDYFAVDMVDHEPGETIEVETTTSSWNPPSDMAFRTSKANSISS